jgi:hypothetical protein
VPLPCECFQARGGRTDIDLGQCNGSGTCHFVEALGNGTINCQETRRQPRESKEVYNGLESS